MAKSPGDTSGHQDGIGFGAAAAVPTGAPGSGSAHGFSEYADDTEGPTSPQSQQGYRSKLWGEDSKEIGTNRVE